MIGWPKYLLKVVAEEHVRASSYNELTHRLDRKRVLADSGRSPQQGAGRKRKRDS
jgi:hypothetical protein